MYFSDADLSAEGELIRSGMKDGLFDAFYQVVKRNHDNPERFLSRAISVMCSIITVADYWWGSEGCIFERYKSVKMPPIVMSLYKLPYYTMNKQRSQILLKKDGDLSCHDLMKIRHPHSSLPIFITEDITDLHKQFKQQLSL